MIRPIVLYGDPVLREISVEIFQGYKLDVKDLVSDLFETMHKANGIGLAAVQIGVPFKVFVIEAHLPDENFHYRGEFINPKVLREWGSLVKHPEGCLSVPQLTGMVERPENLELEWYDEDWNYYKQEFIGFQARIIQHEYDHLEGKIYTDYLDTLWLEAMKRPLQLIEERKMEIPYLWK
jgi:peptide deformylase